jgi:hypothetical protein
MSWPPLHLPDQHSAQSRKHRAAITSSAAMKFRSEDKTMTGDLFANAPRQMKPATHRPSSRDVAAVFNARIVRSEPIDEFNDSLDDVFPEAKTKLPKREPNKGRHQGSATFAEELARYERGGV